ncbi:hypothetical protein [Desulfohalovibrio reitneri]|uniref:hypothetical protein n=1 Tax=Desulfohalovibrio reitneri TaxID=1307759 RepID=UPI0004A72C57|nr:hypothetical protein [Desulfohalovibrio reitneri]
MRYYVIDELAQEDVAKVCKAMDKRDMQGAIADIYYLHPPAELLDEEQTEHQGCGPHVMVLEVEEGELRLELMVRGRGRMRCSCVRYASPEQRQWAMDYLDRFIREQDISV